jgi:hypothetical protein
MPYSLIYQMDYATMEYGDMRLTISDAKSSVLPFSDPTYIYMQGSAQPVKRSFVDNDKDKFKSIRAQKLDIEILSTSTVKAADFAAGEDDRWLVELIVVDTSFTLFKGFLVMDDIEQSLLPQTTYTFTLTANDGLALLKDQPLTKPDGTNPKNEFKVIEFISWALQKTGLQLDIIATTTWMEQSQVAGVLSPWYNFIYLHSKTFEKSIGESVDCYKVLEMIFGFDCSIQQIGGRWWISHTDERSQSQTYKFKFDYQGNYLGTEAAEVYQQTIGDINRELKFINKNAKINYVRPHKSVKLNYKYEFPSEIIDNIDFSRGGIFTPLSMPSGYIFYHVEDWTMVRGGFPGSSATFTGMIARRFELGYEKERYLRLTPASSARTDEYLRCNPIPIGDKDKFSVSVDWRWETDQGGNNSVNFRVLLVVLQGENGSWWVLTKDGRWLLSNAAITQNQQPFIATFNTKDVNESEWQSMTIDSTRGTFNTGGYCDPAPIGGKVYIHLYAGNQAGVGNQNVFYQNLNFDYRPFINGSYAKYNGQSQKVTQTGSYKAKIDETVYISDSPRPLFKGAMFKLINGNYKLTQNWYAAGDMLAQSIAIPPGAEFMHPYGHLQVFAVWNQCNRRMIDITGAVKGLALDKDIPDMHHNYIIDSTTCRGKYFMPSEIEQEYRSDQWSITLLETVDQSISKDYNSAHEFKYEQ